MVVHTTSHGLLFLALLGLPITTSQLSAAEADFYVSLQGNDGWSGRLAEPRGDGGDGPLATLGAARDKIRLLKKPGPLDKPVRVLLRGGTYRLDAPVCFGPEDSGTTSAPIIYAAWPGEKPIFSGGIPITGWKKGPGPLWIVDVPNARDPARQFRQLFVGGRRCTPARTPNEGYFYSAGPAIEWTDRDKADADERTKTSFRYKADDLQTWEDLDDAVRSDAISLLCDIAVRLKRRIVWDPKQATIVGDDEAAKLMRRPMRPPWTL